MKEIVFYEPLYKQKGINKIYKYFIAAHAHVWKKGYVASNKFSKRPL